MTSQLSSFLKKHIGENFKFILFVDIKVLLEGCGPATPHPESGAKIVRLILKKELSGLPSPNINVGYEFEGLWTSPDLCYNIDTGVEGGDCVVSRIFAPDCSLPHVILSSSPILSLLYIEKVCAPKFRLLEKMFEFLNYDIRYLV